MLHDPFGYATEQDAIETGLAAASDHDEFDMEGRCRAKNAGFWTPDVHRETKFLGRTACQLGDARRDELRRPSLELDRFERVVLVSLRKKRIGQVASRHDVTHDELRSERRRPIVSLPNGFVRRGAQIGRDEHLRARARCNPFDRLRHGDSLPDSIGLSKADSCRIRSSSRAAVGLADTVFGAAHPIRFFKFRATENAGELLRWHELHELGNEQRRA